MRSVPGEGIARLSRLARQVGNEAGDIAIRRWVWLAFALAALLPSTSTQSVAVPAAPSSCPEN